MSLSPLVLGGALALDATLGEPPERLHPVAWLGSLVAALDREWQHPRAAGAVLAIAVPAGAGLGVAGSVLLAGQASPLAAAAVGALAVFVSTSLRRLVTRVRGVVSATESDLDLARDRLLALAGRDATDLSGGELRSAAVESLAENLADGLVGPLLAYTCLVVGATTAGAGGTAALAVGCGGAAWVKAVNTLDSMLGYHSKPVGWAPARLDDAAMWLPARASALLLAVALARPGAVLSARRWQADLASPNSGWPMGTLAAGLDVRLEKPGHYVLNPECPLPDSQTAGVAVRRVTLAGLLAYGLAGVVTWL